MLLSVNINDLCKKQMPTKRKNQRGRNWERTAIKVLSSRHIFSKYSDEYIPLKLIESLKDTTNSSDPAKHEQKPNRGHSFHESPINDN